MFWKVDTYNNLSFKRRENYFFLAMIKFFFANKTSMFLHLYCSIKFYINYTLSKDFFKMQI